MLVENQHLSYSYGQSEPYVGFYVDSVLSFDLNDMPLDTIYGRYWCRVLVKTLDDYSYSVAGRSNTETVISNNENYPSHQPPCIGGMTFHQPSFKCVQDDTRITAPASDSVDITSARDGSNVLISSGGLAAVAVTGGALIVTLLILLFVVVYSCRVLNSGRKANGKAKGLCNSYTCIYQNSHTKWGYIL